MRLSCVRLSRVRLSYARLSCVRLSRVRLSYARLSCVRLRIGVFSYDVGVGSRHQSSSDGQSP
ncbi:pentapeptide repeat-containing protein [Streptomyces ipomoeae]|uniref:pentapeptide repeat-containing protein n=1 Tax=Streptomyces ipomoeae TaxID=103232 RepID=UPI0038D3EF4F